MGKGLEMPFFSKEVFTNIHFSKERRYTNDKHTLEKMLSIIYHLDNESKPQEVLLHAHQNSYNHKNKNSQDWQGYKKLELVYIASRNVKWCRCGRKHFGSFSKS